MSDASDWIVVPTHREFLSTPQFVPVESVMRGSLWRVMRHFCVLGGDSIWGMEPPVLSRWPCHARAVSGSIVGMADGELFSGPPTGTVNAAHNSGFFGGRPTLLLRPAKNCCFYSREAYMQGTIKKVVRERAFGFIHAADKREVFFHRSSLQGLNFEDLREGDAVEFDVEQSEKGPRAANVRPQLK